MRKTIFLSILLIFTMSTTMVFAGKKSASEKAAITMKAENKLSEAELKVLTTRVEAIRSMDKSEMSSLEKRELRKELRGIKENVRRSDGVIYIGGSTLLLIIILIILL